MPLHPVRTTASTVAEHVSDHNAYRAEFDTPTHTHSGAYAPSTGIPRSLGPMSIVGVASIGGANQCRYQRAIDGSASVGHIVITVSTSSGNISAAVCTGPLGRANPTSRAATSGAIPCPAAGAASIALGAAVPMDGTSWFALSADNNTATFGVNAAAGSNIDAVTLGLMGLEASAHPVPATPGATNCTYYNFLMVGAA
jgi:hypothetical protein